MLMFNPTEKEIEFLVGGVPYIFKPKEVRDLPEYIAMHAVERAKVPLVQHSQMYDKEVEFSDVVYSQLPWKKLVQMASARGLYVFGDKKPDILRKLEEYDAKK